LGKELVGGERKGGKKLETVLFPQNLIAVPHPKFLEKKRGGGKELGRVCSSFHCGESLFLFDHEGGRKGKGEKKEDWKVNTKANEGREGGDPQF